MNVILEKLEEKIEEWAKQFEKNKGEATQHVESTSFLVVRVLQGGGPAQLIVPVSSSGVTEKKQKINPATGTKFLETQGNPWELRY